MKAEEKNRVCPVVHPIVIRYIAAAIYEKKHAKKEELPVA